MSQFQHSSAAELQPSPLPESLVLGGESNRTLHSDAVFLAVDAAYHPGRREDIYRPPYSRERVFSSAVFDSSSDRWQLWLEKK